MADNPVPGSLSVPEIQARLQAVAHLLEDSSSLDPVSGRALAELLDELSRAIQSAQVPPAEMAHLAESTARLAESLHYQHDRGVLGSVRDRFEQAAVNAETHAPLATGLARRLLETLANLGI
jgi:hypothetical protein